MSRGIMFTLPPMQKVPKKAAMILPRLLVIPVHIALTLTLGIKTAYAQADCNTNEVDVVAKFPFGSDSLMRFFDYHMRWVDGRASGKGYIVVTFIVKEDGKVSNAQIKENHFFNSFEKEAIRLVEIMPSWIPAVKDHRKVCSKVELPIKFELE
jgi:TonB family protein